MAKVRSTAAGVLTILLAGCSSAPPTAPDSGARAVVRDYFEAVVRKDWQAAYAALNAESRAQVSAGQFAQQADRYRRRLAFEPQEIVVRSCEERGTEALAHIVIKGQAAGRVRSYKDGVVLRQAGAGWRVVLAPRFGENR
jgi:hypothetical protein